MPESETIRPFAGAGLAGAIGPQRRFGPRASTARIVLIGEEPHRPYERPPLSKGYLSGKDEREKAFVHPEVPGTAENQVELRSGMRVAAIDRGRPPGAPGPTRAASATRSCCWPPGRARPAPAGARRQCRPGGLPAHHRRLRAACAGLFGQISRLVVVGAGWIGPRGHGGRPAARAWTWWWSSRPRCRCCALPRPGDGRGLRRIAPRANGVDFRLQATRSARSPRRAGYATRGAACATG